MDQKRAAWFGTGVVLVAIILLTVVRTYGVSAAPSPPPPTEQELVTALVRVGLSAERLAAAQVSSGSVSGIVSGVRDYLGSYPTAIADADRTSFEAKAEWDRLRRLVRSGLASQEEITESQTASVAYEAARAARDEVLGDVFDAGVGNLSQEETARLSRLRANGEAWKVPLQFLVVDRAEPDWVRLRNALANERISAKLGEEPDSGAQDHLATCRDDAEVAASRTYIDTYLSSIETAWDSAVAQ